jgi:hypothetical protein
MVGLLVEMLGQLQRQQHLIGGRVRNVQALQHSKQEFEIQLELLECRVHLEHDAQAIGSECNHDGLDRADIGKLGFERELAAVTHAMLDNGTLTTTNCWTNNVQRVQDNHGLE